MKGYQVKDIRNNITQERVYTGLIGVKRYLSQFHYPVKETGKNWKDTLRELDWEIWEVEITPTKKII